MSLLALLCFLLELVKVSLEPGECLQKQVAIRYLVTGVGISQEWLEALSDGLDTSELLIAEFEVHLM
jgi:hypothetical protein